MGNIRVNINGRELIGEAGQTILDIARANGIEIPTLCHDDRVKTYAACGICLVEVEGMPRLLRACSTAAGDGMAIKTDTPRVNEARKAALELLLSDHTGDCRPPCALACPGKTDCQGYVGLIANGEFKEALKVIKDKIPLPASIGRVCPHPCEDACRRELVEEPISIANLKSFAADMDLMDGEAFMPEIKNYTGKTVAIAGGGPGGLSAAYYLCKEGHDVTVYDAMPKMGGMLRYGIPEYRLPKSVVDSEVSLIERMGVELVNGVKIGRDVTLAYLQENYDAVVVAIGAWSSMGLGCPGEELKGVLGGIDFLRDVAMGDQVLAGKRVAIVGGGNTAMDACRTAVRLGATEVYNIYRRTKDEMPAEEIEITEAEEEGVIFKYLTNPIEIIGDGDGKVQKMRLQKMELGEPDASGRRAPVAIVGAEETLELDTVIVAIGQKCNPAGFEELELSKRKTILADENSYRTNLENVFAVGDATNKGASIAIEAIGEAQRAADVINSYLEGEIIPYKAPFLVTTEKTAEDFANKEKMPRSKMRHLKPEQRKDNFEQVNLQFSIEEAMNDAKRCLECGCWDYFECKLVDYANRYDVKPEKFKGAEHRYEPDESNPFLYRNMEKCILCGLCVRVCDEVMGRSALGLVNRGFDTVVKPSLALPLAETDCISCGQCVTVCPTGALLERTPLEKPVPMEESTTDSVCSFCSVGCKTKLKSRGESVARSLPGGDSKSVLCVKGRFGFGEMEKDDRIFEPMLRKDGELVEVEPYEALMYITKKAQSISAKYGPEAMGVAVSDKYTNEEIFIIKRYAQEVLKLKNIFSFGAAAGGIKDVFGGGASTNTFEELSATEVILLFSDDIINRHTIAGIKIKQAVENGAKLFVISRGETQADEWASGKIKTENNLDVLKQIARALIDQGLEPKNALGFEQLKAALGTVTVGAEVKALADTYGKAKKAMIVFDESALSDDAAKLIADIAVISGHVGKPRNGVIALKPNSNSQGLEDMGVVAGGSEGLKGLIIFGEDVPGFDRSNLEFLAVQDYTLTETAKKADCVLPGATGSETWGTYTNTTRRIQEVNSAVSPAAGWENWEIVQDLANVSNEVFDYGCACEIMTDIAKTVPGYFGADKADLETGDYWPIGESPVLYENGFATEDGKARLQVPVGEAMYAERANTNAGYVRFVEFLEAKGLLADGAKHAKK